MKKRSLIWKVPLALMGIALGLVLLLLIAVGCVLYVPSVRQVALEKALVMANEKLDFDIDLGDLYLSPFHHSPMVLYRAYKGEADLPLQVDIDSLFIGHRGQDTLLYTRTLRLRAILKTAAGVPMTTIDDLLATPIEVEHLELERATFHSDSMIASVGVDVNLMHLYTHSPEVVIAQGQYPLHDLRLYDAFVGIDLRDTPPDTTAHDTTPLLMAYDIPNGDLRNIHFLLTPLGLDIRTKTLQTSVLVDVGGDLYHARRMDVSGYEMQIGRFYLPLDTLYGNARVDLRKDRITSTDLHAISTPIGAQADLSATKLNLATMRVDVEGAADYRGSSALLQGYYDIDDEVYALHADVEKVDLSPFMTDSTRVVLAGVIEAEGKGIDPARPLRSKIKMHLADCIYEDFDFSGLDMDFATDTTTTLNLSTRGLRADLQTPTPLFRFLDEIPPLLGAIKDSSSLFAMIDSIPSMSLQMALTPGHPLQRYVDSTRAELSRLDIALYSDSLQKKLSVAGDARLTDGVMTLHGLHTDADLTLDVERTDDDLHGTGRLTMRDLSYGDMDFGKRTVDVKLARSDNYANALRADIRMDDLPLELADSILKMADLDLSGSLRAQAVVDGLPQQIDLSAEVLPLEVSALYKPYDVRLSLGETPVVMRHNKVDLNGLPIYGVDSTFIALTGGLDLDAMRLDVTLAADSFAPTKLEKDGPFPVYGELATDIRGHVTGPLDSIVADVDVTLLPTTDITYPIDKKNLAQVKPHGTVNVHYDLGQDTLLLGGQVNVDDGIIRYSPKAYPMMPFRVDSGSHVAFHGPIGKTLLDVSASQQVKADVQSKNEETRRVEFNTGVRVNGTVDSIGLHSIGFFLEAPEDETITHELASLDEETREGLAATLLATGMYVGESNEAAQRSGYALSSIINSRINAALANSKAGKVVDIDFSSAQTEHAAGKTNDMNISISKSFLKDKLRITVGTSISDNPEVNSANGLLQSLTADYKLTKDGNVQLHLFSQRDYNNVLEGELYKSGLGVRATKDWRRMEVYKGDSIARIYSLTADAGVAYRSNNSIGPDLTLKSSIKNLMGRGETFSIKGNGAYYWAIRHRHPGDPRKSDTYKFGINTSLVFPYLHWVGDNNPDGDTRYMLGYQYENIAGGYGVHKLSGSLSYFFHSSQYITHVFTPLSLSVVLMKAETDSLLNKAADYPQLIELIAGTEFVPAVGYNFIYNDYRSKRAVNTLLDLGVKESGNLINAIYCAFGHKWNEKNKPLGSITFNQFVKLSMELRNKFNLTDKICIATRLFAGANIPLGNSTDAPLSEAFYAGGPNSMRAASPYAYGPGNFYSPKYNQNFFHAGDVKLEANFEFRFPIVWKLYGAAFLDAGNVWSWVSARDRLDAQTYQEMVEKMQLPDNLQDGLIDNPDILRQIALGTGAGLRLDIDGLVIRLDLGVGIHAPYQTYHYDKKGKPDMSRPITTYFNIPSAWDALRLNFGIGYPF